MSLDREHSGYATKTPTEPVAMSGSASRRSDDLPRLPDRSAAVAAWLLATLILYALSLSVDAGASLLGPTAIAIGLWIFFRSGGSQVDAIGVWGLACILFTGVGSMLMPKELITNSDTTATALLIAISGTLAVAWIAWIPAKHTNHHDPRLKSFDLHWMTLLLLGIIGFFLGVLMSTVDALWNFAQGMLMASPPLAALGAASAGPHRRLALIVPGGLVAWYLFAWQGDGRLVVLALLLAVLMAYQVSKTSWRQTAQGFWFRFFLSQVY